MNNKAEKPTLIRKLFCFLSAALTALSGLPVFYCVWSVGIWFPTLFFFAAFLIAVFWDKIRAVSKTRMRFAMIIIAVILILCIVFASVLSVLMLCSFSYGDTENTTIVVLGCEVREDGPSKMLRLRLDTAYDLLSENDELCCVVAGGMVDDEPEPESVQMKKYLVEKGIAVDRIFEDNSSENTYENLENSKKIIEENNLGEKMLIVTDGFHQLRAKILASKQNIKTSGRSSSTPVYLLFPFWVREWFGICRAIALGY